MAKLKVMVKVKAMMTVIVIVMVMELTTSPELCLRFVHNDVIKWKHFPHYWPFVGGIHRSPMNSPHKGQWHVALMFPLICAWINSWVNNREADDLRRHHAHYDVIVMCYFIGTEAIICFTSATVNPWEYEEINEMNPPRTDNITKN